MANHFFKYLLGAFVLFSFALQAQERGKPFLKNYAPKEYGGQSQNWYVAQDHRGVMYIGNGDGVLEYDGNAWHTTELPSKVTVRSVAVTDNNVVYVGHTSGFGYLRIDEQGKNVYVPLDEQLPDTVQQNLSDIWELYTVGDVAYFRTRPYIFRHKDGKLDYWRVNPGQTSFYSSFVHNGKFYASSFGPRGSREVRTDVGDELRIVDDNKLFFNRVTSIHIPYKKDTIILGNRRGGFYKYPFSPNHKEDSLGLLGDLNTKLGAYGGAYTDGVAYDGGYAIGTNSGGILLLDENYKILGTINQKDNGLISNQVYHTAIDRDGALWAGLSNGIARVDVASDVSYWDEGSGLDGSVYFVKRYKGDLYINTSMSSYILEGNKIRKISNNIAAQCWHLMEFKNPDNPEETALWLSTSSLYSLKPDGARLILQQPFPRAIFKMYQDPKDIRRIWCATGAGLGSILWENGKWTIEPIIPETKEDCRSIIRDDKGNLWVGTYRGGVFKLTPTDGNRGFDVKHYTEENGMLSTTNTLFYEIDGEVIMATGAGLCQYNPDTDRFEPYTKLGEEFANGSRDVYIMDQASNGNVWLTGEILAKSHAVTVKRRGEGMIVDNQPFKKVPPMVAENIMIEEDGVAWLGGSEGLYRYAPHEGPSQAEKPYSTLIREVVIGNDSIIFSGSFPQETPEGFATASKQQVQRKIPAVDSDHNSVDFYFAAPFFDNEEQTQYQFYLEGFEKGWSDWAFKREKEYTNLGGGDYIFHVRAKNLYGNISEEATYQIKIKYPWYMTWWAFTLYLIAAVLTIWFFVNLNAKRLERENLRLEGIINERTAEVRAQADQLSEQNTELSQQKEEIQAQAEELERANASMSHLSDIGKAITSTLDIRTVIRIIYESVNELMDASGFGVGVYREEENILEFKGYMERGEVLPDHHEQVTDDMSTVALRVFHTKESFFSNDLQGDMKREGIEMKVVQGDTPLSLMYMPLIYGHDTVGVITVQSFNKDAYTENDINILQNVAAYASIALANAKGYELIQEKNRNITDSIRYSETIQKAYLPSEQEMKELGEYFFLYRPRDIVSGDFHWTMKLEDENKLYVAVVDCTGHGVPGSFMSIVGVNLLNEIVELKNVREPADILEELNQGVVHALNQESEAEDTNDDGMDVCLCMIEKLSDTKTKVTFAGAKRDLYYIRKGSQEVEYLHGDNKLIGGYQKKGKSFQNHIITLDKGDAIYLTTDGYVDQHDAHRKKYGTLRLKALLPQIVSKPMEEQGRILDEEFDKHRGKMEQRDDVTMLGMRL